MSISESILSIGHFNALNHRRSYTVHVKSIHERAKVSSKERGYPKPVLMREKPRMMNHVRLTTEVGSIEDNAHAETTDGTGDGDGHDP